MENAPLLELEFDALLEGDVEEPNFKAKRRFASLTEDEIRSIDEGRRPQSMRQTTEKWIRAVKSYVNEKDLRLDLATISPEEHGKFLRQMYVKLRTAKGGFYSKSSLQTDDDDQDDVDEALALALPEQLAELEKPNASLTSITVVRPASATPGPVPAMNFAGASFSGCTFHFSPNQVKDVP